ncbi:MAG: hypothetical protein H9W82_12250 [Lactobacillus sp.]|nr:hypothetical protein [Lactobacillus sp.]
MDNQAIETVVLDKSATQTEDTKTFTQSELDNIISERLQEEKDKYSQLENEYNNYRFDIEFKQEMNDLANILPKNTQDVLKALKKKLNDKEYLEVKEGIVGVYLAGKTPSSGMSKGINKNKSSFEEALKQRR